MFLVLNLTEQILTIILLTVTGTALNNECEDPATK